MKILIAALLLSAGASAMAQGFFIQSRHEVSKRFAVFEDDERVGYLYLAKPGTPKLEKDAIAYSRIKPVERNEWDIIKKTGGTPLLTRELASETAIVARPVEREFSFKWSQDGHSVALLRRGVPIAFASASEKFGYSKAVVKSSALVNVWDQVKYESLFSQ